MKLSPENTIIVWSVQTVRKRKELCRTIHLPMSVKALEEVRASLNYDHTECSIS